MRVRHTVNPIITEDYDEGGVLHCLSTNQLRELLKEKRKA